MALTIINWILVGLVFILGIAGAGVFFCNDSKSGAIIVILITIIVCFAILAGCSWWHNNTASGARAMKDFRSDIHNGINREITITAEDGREIFHYEGKIDVETSHTNSENYILFESEEGLRYIIYYGVQDTVLIIEKEG